MQRYQKRISRPLMDRIDIHLEVASVQVEKLAGLAPGEPSSMSRQRCSVLSGGEPEPLPVSFCC